MSSFFPYLVNKIHGLIKENSINKQNSIIFALDFSLRIKIGIDENKAK